MSSKPNVESLFKKKKNPVKKLVSSVFTFICLYSLSPLVFWWKASDVPSAVVSLYFGHSLAGGTKVDKERSL